MVASVISSGFKWNGIYPFNSQPIDYGAATKKSSDVSIQETSKAMKGSGDTVNIDNEMLNLSHEQVQLYEKWYGEGYNLPDPVYLRWLKITHPKQDQTVDQQSRLISEGEKKDLQLSKNNTFNSIIKKFMICHTHPEHWNETVSSSEL